MSPRRRWFPGHRVRWPPSQDASGLIVPYGVFRGGLSRDHPRCPVCPRVSGSAPPTVFHPDERRLRADGPAHPLRHTTGRIRSAAPVGPSVEFPHDHHPTAVGRSCLSSHACARSPGTSCPSRIPHIHGRTDRPTPVAPHRPDSYIIIPNCNFYILYAVGMHICPCSLDLG